MTPEDRKFTKSHEWILREGDLFVVGITDHAQEMLGDITFVELPEPDEDVEAGHDCSVVESVKAASDLYAPMDGRICEVNNALADHPEIINEDPYGRGWIFKLSGCSEEDYEALLSAVIYDNLVDVED